jgi:hypothetical protein
VVQTTEFILMLDNLVREFVGGIVVDVLNVEVYRPTSFIAGCDM